MSSRMVKGSSEFAKMLNAPLYGEKAEKAFKELKAEIKHEMKSGTSKPRSGDAYASSGTSLTHVHHGRGKHVSTDKTVGHHGITERQFLAGLKQTRKALKPVVQRALAYRLPATQAQSFLIALGGKGHLKEIDGKAAKYMTAAAKSYIKDKVSYQPLGGNKVAYKYQPTASTTPKKAAPLVAYNVHSHVRKNGVKA